MSTNGTNGVPTTISKAMAEVFDSEDIEGIRPAHEYHGAIARLKRLSHLDRKALQEAGITVGAISHGQGQRNIRVHLRPKS